MAQSQAQAPHPPLEGAQLVIGTIAVSLAVFMNVLDTSIANVSIPSISGDLGVSSDQGTWVITSMALSMWAMTTLIAPVAGPILGGWISDNILWPWIFYVNIPVGVVAALATWAIFRNRDSVIKKAPIDVVGLLLLITWVGSLQIMLDKGKDLDWFSSTTIVVLALVAVIALAFFSVWELTAEHPVVDLSLFELRNFTGGTIALSIGYGLYFGNLVLLPLWQQTDIGYTATDAGLVVAPVGFFAI